MKKMYSKKLLAMLSALSMTVGMFTAVPASATTQSILNENFDGATYAPNRWVSVSVDDTGNAAYGKAVHFQTVGEDNAADGTFRQIGHNFGTAQNGGTVIYSFDINAEAFNTSAAQFNYIDVKLFVDVPNRDWNNSVFILRIGSLSQDGKVHAYPAQPHTANGNTINDNGIPRELTKKQWYRIDMIVDLDESQITYYLNGASWYSQELKDTSENKIKSFGGIAIQRNNLYHNTSVFVDNINIRKVDSGMGDIKIESSSFNNTGNYVDVKFSETIRDSADDLEDMIRVNNAKNNSSVAIDSITKLTADTVRISFAKDTLSAASEYKVTLNGINNPFGDSVSETVTFNTPSSKDNSVVEGFNAFDVSEKKIMFGSIYDSSNGATTYTLVEGKSGDTSDKAVQIQKVKGTCGYPAFRMNFDARTNFDFNNQRWLGSTSYEFDFKFPSTTDGDNKPMILTLESGINNQSINIVNVNGKDKNIIGYDNKSFVRNIDDKWHNIKTVVDWVKNKINYYYDGTMVKELDCNLSSFGAMFYKGYLACSSTDANGCVDYTIDNFKISYEETATQGVGEDNTIGIKGFAVTESENGYTVSGTGVNTYAEEKKITVIVCGYDSNGVLTYVNCDPEVALGALRTTAISKEYETDKGSIATVKAFAWENTTGMTPCVMPAQYSNN